MMRRGARCSTPRPMRRETRALSPSPSSPLYERTVDINIVLYLPLLRNVKRTGLCVVYDALMGWVAPVDSRWFTTGYQYLDSVLHNLGIV
jgi:hypothetical protein